MKPPKTRGERLRQARIAAGFRSSASAAEALGMKPGTYNAHERAGQPGARDYDPDQAMTYSRKFKVDVSWLLNAVGRGPHDAAAAAEHEANGGHIESDHILSDAPPSSAKKTVPLVGYVGAGSKAHFYALAHDEFEPVEAPEGATDQSVAVEIKGKSFGPLMDGWLVHYDDVRAPVTDDMLNKICVVGLADDRILLKKIKREADGTFTLISNSDEPPITNAVIEWAAMVVSFKPR